MSNCTQYKIQRMHIYKLHSFPFNTGVYTHLYHIEQMYYVILERDLQIRNHHLYKSRPKLECNQDDRFGQQTPRQ